MRRFTSAKDRRRSSRHVYGSHLAGGALSEEDRGGARQGSVIQRSSEWDMCIVFPFDNKHSKDTSVENFQARMLGLNPKDPGADESMDAERTAFRTERCFLGRLFDAQGAAHMRKWRHFGGTKEESAAYVEAMKSMLWREYMEWHEQHSPLLQQREAAAGAAGAAGMAGCIGARAKMSSRHFCELVAVTVVARLQRACGLETKMYYSADDDEIFCLIRTDTGDLKNEAMLEQYRLQVGNRYT